MILPARIELLAVNGQIITDFKSVSIKEQEIFKTVNLMNKTAHIRKTPRHGLDVEYVKPSQGAIDWTKVENGTLVITPEGGPGIRYTGVYVTKVGAEKYDGENEVTQTIELSAEARS